MRGRMRTNGSGARRPTGLSDRPARAMIGRCWSGSSTPRPGACGCARMIAVVACCIALAIFGTFLLVLTPVLGRPRGPPDRLGAVLGVPPEVPAGLPAVVVHRAQQGVAGEAAQVERGGDARDPRLPGGRGGPLARACPTRRPACAYLQREAWNVADRVGGDLKVDAVNVALHIDQLGRAAGAARPRRASRAMQPARTPT